MSAGGLGLNYLREARAVLDIYYEDQYPDDEIAGRRSGARMLMETVACALVSIAGSLERIVDEAEEEALAGLILNEKAGKEETSS